MRNPWLDIPLADYEGHMSLPSVDQARLLADDGICSPGAVLVTVTQQTSGSGGVVTPSAFSRIQALSAVFRPISPEHLKCMAEDAGLRPIEDREVASTPGKRFAVQAFRREDSRAGMAGG